MDGKTIAIVDDRKSILAAYGELFRNEGYNVHCFSGGVDLINRLAALEVDLVLLDIDLGRGLAGWQVQDLLAREHPELRVIFMTAVALDDDDEARGLEAGAADYIRKGSDPRILLARVRRELSARGTAVPETSDGRIIAGDLVLDALCLSCSWKGRDVPLTVSEFRILEEMAGSPGRVKSRDTLLAAAGNGEDAATERAADSHIKRIRRKLRSVDSAFAGIRTHSGAGYSWRFASP